MSLLLTKPIRYVLYDVAHLPGNLALSAANWYGQASFSFLSALVFVAEVLAMLGQSLFRVPARRRGVEVKRIGKRGRQAGKSTCGLGRGARQRSNHEHTGYGPRE